MSKNSIPSIGGNFWTFSACFDTHGKYINWDSAKAYLSHLEAFKPDFRIHGGDAFDFEWGRTNASQYERCGAVLEDVEEGIKFLDLMRPTHITLGNHDDRIFNFIRHTAQNEEYRKSCELSGDTYQRNCRATSNLEELGAELILKKVTDCFKRNNTTQIQYKRGVGLKIGKQWFAHGFFMGDGAVKNMINTYKGNVFFGHLHCFDQYTMANIDQDVGQCVGSLCDDAKMNYQRVQPRSIKHENGWVYGAIHKKTGEVYYCLARRRGGVWFTPDIK